MAYNIYTKVLKYEIFFIDVHNVHKVPHDSYTASCR